MSAGRFEGRVAVVTGAAGNIGSVVCSRLVSEGAKVLAVDVDGAAAAKTAEALGDAAQPFAADVSSSADVAAYVAAARELGGGEIHAFFNNAGIEGPVAPIESYDDDEFDRVMAVNVRGVFLGLKHVTPHMPTGGSVVNTASAAGSKGFAALSGYTASKHAVIGLTRVAALELAPRGVRVNAIAPGPVEGRMMEAIEAGVDVEDPHAVFVATVPFGRYVKPVEISNSVVYLLSEEAAFVTGTAFANDGGQTA
jgi:NAD(P)-dependent dehydrogenase (short-subunit alcohol dehydrogenase family)